MGYEVAVCMVTLTTVCGMYSFRDFWLGINTY